MLRLFGRLKNHLVIVISLILSLSSASLFAVGSIGIAKDVDLSGRTVTYTFYLENIGLETIDTLALQDNLDTVFGAGNYVISAGPTFLDDPGSINLNSNFDGSADTALISTSSELAASDTASFTIEIEVTAVTDQGGGPGSYSNQVTISGLDLTPAVVSDISDSGVNPDPDSDGDAGGVNEDDPTVIDFIENPVIGAAKQATLSGSQVTFDFYIENYGNRELSSITLTDNLDTVFGAGNYTVSSAPSFVDNPATLTLNAGYDGSTNINLISSGTVAEGDTAQIRVVIDVTSISDQGSGFGVYSNQASVSALSPQGISTSDLSDNGIESDPSLANEDDPTTFVIGEEPVIGISTNATVSGDDVTLDFYIENIGNVLLSSITLSNDLNTIFGANNYSISTPPFFVDDPGTLVLEAGYDGNAISSLLSSGNLSAGDMAQIRMVVSVVALSDQGSGEGIYSNQVSIFASAPGGGTSTDISDNGTNPDPDSDGNPNEAGENDSTTIIVAERPSIGLALDVIHDSSTTKRFQYKIENLGNVTLNNMLLDNNLDTVFGAGNYIVTGRSLINNPGTIDIDNAYNGGVNLNLILSSSSLEPLASVTVETTIFVITVIDQGSGLGEFQTQTSVSADSPALTTVTDISDSGSETDTNNNGNANESGENDPTDFSMLTKLGVALDANVVNNQVTFYYYLEAFSTNTTDISLSNSLDGILGAGNYVISSAPSFIDDPGTVTLNSLFDGSDSDNIISAGSLAAGDTAQIQIVVDITNLINSNGFGNYENQVTVFGLSDVGDNLSDDSHSGTDPDPDGDDDPTNENTATSFSIPIDFITGSALDASVTGSVITLDFYLENFGVSTAENLMLAMNMDDIFGAGNYSISTAASFADDPGTISLNGGYDGSADTELLAPGSALNALGTAQIQLQVTILTVTDSQGLGSGVYELQATSTTTDGNGISVSDLSNSGTDPDASDSDGDPTDPGLGDPPIGGDNQKTSAFIGLSSIGIAEAVSVSGTTITYDIYIENLGPAELNTITLVKPLDVVFGAGNYSVSGASVVSGNLSVGTYFGFSVFTTLVGGGTLAAGEIGHVTFNVTVNTVSDQGNGLGVYQTQSTINALDLTGAAVTDTSDMGTDPDPDGDGNANEAGENDVTVAVIGEEPSIGIAKDISVTGQQITFDIYLENFGNTNLSAMSLVEDLDSLFGSGNYSINTAPTFIDSPGTITLNGGFDGSADTNLFTSQTLNVTDTAQVRFIIDITTVADTGSGLGSYSTQSSITGTGVLGSIASDSSDDGTDPDPDGDSNANEVDENDATTFIVGVTEAGIALNVTSIDGQVIFDYYLENFGTVTATNLAVVNNIDAIFGAGNWSLNAGPALVSIERDVAVNSSFDGITDIELLSGSLGAGHTAQVQVIIDVDSLTDMGSGLGVYTNQVTLTGDNGISDLSDDGINPDPDGNNNPGDASENDISDFTLTKTATTSTLTASNNTPVNGESVTFTVTVLDGISSPASGNIDLKIDNVLVSSQSLDSSGQATFTNSYAFASDPAASVEFLENVNYSGSTDTLNLTVGQAATSTTIDSSTNNPTTTDVATTIGFTVAVASPGTGAIVGTVTVSDGVDICSSVVSGINILSSSCSLSLSTAGTRTLNATFVSSAPHLLGGVSANFNQTVNNTSGSISINDTTPTQGQLLTATVTDIDGISGGISYQWNRGMTIVSTAQTYTTVQADVGATLIVNASYIDDGGSSEAPVSSVTSAVINVNDVGSVAIDDPTPTQNQTLTATVTDLDGATGSISYQWQSNDSNVGTNSASYTTVQSDVGNTLTVRATYSDDLSSAESPNSAATSAVANVNDAGSVAIDDPTPSQNQTLTATVTDLDGATGSISYQWQSNGSNVGTNSASYITAQSDVGNILTVRATYTDDLSSVETPVSTATSAVANVNDAGSVAINDTTPTQNQTLTAAVTDLDGTTGSISYQWQSNGSNVGSNNSSYTTMQSDVGNTLTVRATYTDDFGSVESPISTISGIVSNINDLGSVVIDDPTPEQSQILTATVTDVDEVSGVITFQWRSNGSNVGINSANYTVTQSDVGNTLTVQATYTDDLGGAESPVSAPTSIVTNINDLPSGQPFIIGSLLRNEILSVDTSSILDDDGLGIFNYQWRRSGVTITGANNSTYLLGEADIGFTLSVILSYIDGAGTSESLSSPETGVIADLDSDGDGISDLEEGTGDSDGDGIPDYLDEDSDNDGIPDSVEGTDDADGDGIPNYLDISLDEDGDGIPDALESNNQLDTDGDGVLDAFDTDSDNDGISDFEESGAFGTDTDGDGIDDAFDVDVTGGIDANGDGIDDDVAILDSDGDLIADYIDRDSDNDSIPDALENNTGLQLKALLISMQNSQLATSDIDGDGIMNYLDNDSDEDGISDLVEAATNFIDSDSDQVIDEFDPDFTGGLDVNLDGVDDAAAIQNSDNDVTPDMFDLDADNDGLFDVNEAGLNDIDLNALVDSPLEVTDTPIDSDSDGLADYLDLDSDNDGIFDISGGAAATLDSDDDGKIDNVYADADADVDGIVDIMDDEPNQFGTRPDRDLDGIPSLVDLDDDGDGLTDLAEGNIDTDGDGMVDSLDTDSDNDGISDTEEQLTVGLAGVDLDHDGLDDAVDVDFTGGNDANGDGQDDSTFSTDDLDGDGLLAFRDRDTDGDGIVDSSENGDFNNDGVNDRLQVHVEVTATSGGGALYGMLGLLLLFNVFRSVEKVRKWLITLIVFMGVLISFSSSAQENGISQTNQPHWYAGIGVGQTELEPITNGTAFVVSDDSSTAVKFYLGFEFNANWFAELDFMQLGKAQLRNNNPAIAGGFINYNASVAAVGYKISPDDSAYGFFVKAGWAEINTNSNFIADDDESVAVMGLGVDWELNEKNMLRVGYEQIGDDIKLISISIKATF